MKTFLTSCNWLFLAALVLTINGVTPVHAQSPADCGHHGSSTAQCTTLTNGTIGRRSSVRALGGLLGPVDTEILSTAIVSRMREVRQRALRDLIENLAQHGLTSRPLEDILGVLLSLVDVGGDGTAVAQSITSAVIRDSISYAIAGLTVAGVLEDRGCGNDVHVLASAAYEALAQSRLGSLGFPAATEQVPCACAEYSASVTAVIDLLGSDASTEAIEFLPQPAAPGAAPGATPGSAPGATPVCMPSAAPVSTPGATGVGWTAALDRLAEICTVPDAAGVEERAAAELCGTASPPAWCALREAEALPTWQCGCPGRSPPHPARSAPTDSVHSGPWLARSRALLAQMSK